MTPAPTTVLIAEDDPVFRRVMVFSIARQGLTVECVSDGEAAYQRLCLGGISFLVTDHQMPICSGVELLERMATSNTGIVRPPAILCTAKGLELDSADLQSRYDLVAVMHKPFSPRRLSERIVTHLAHPDQPKPFPSLLVSDPSIEPPQATDHG